MPETPRGAERERRASPALGCLYRPLCGLAFELPGACRAWRAAKVAPSEAPRYARPMSELEKVFGRRSGSAGGSVSEPMPDRAAYEPPPLRALGTLAELTSGVVGKSDGLGPGSAVEPGP